MKTLKVLLALVGFLFCGQSLFAAPLDHWQWRNPMPNSNPQTGPHTMTGVVFANGQFVAVGATGVAATSSDAINWTESATATTNQLNALAYLNGLFVAVAGPGPDWPALPELGRAQTRLSGHDCLTIAQPFMAGSAFNQPTKSRQGRKIARHWRKILPSLDGTLDVSEK